MLNADDLFNAAQSLAPAERWQLLTRLWDALADEGWSIGQADLEEIQRRSAEFDAGKSVTINRDEVRQRIRERLYVRQAINAGLEDSDADRVVDVEETRQQFGLPP